MTDVVSFKRSLAVVYIWTITILFFTLISNPFRKNSLYNKPENLRESAIQVANDSQIKQKTPFKDEKFQQTDVYQSYSNIPLIYWNKEDASKHYKNTTCAKYPTIQEIEFNNIHWQVLRSKNGTFYFFNAYYDKRKHSSIYPAVRILAMIDRFEPTVSTFCQFWFDSLSEAVIAETTKYTYIWYKTWGNVQQGILQPYLISCQIPLLYKNLVPVSVSIVDNKCDTASNNLKIVYNKPVKKKDFLVCVKGLNYPKQDLTARLIEWIELLDILGVNKITFYELQIHPNVSKVLKHYENTGLVDVVPLTLPGGQPNYPFFQHLYLSKFIRHKRQNELIPYNDCFYKNIYSYKFIVLLDIDEVIVPKKEPTWKSLMYKLRRKAKVVLDTPTTTYCARHVYFFDDWFSNHTLSIGIPRYMHMLHHIYRSGNFTRPFYNIKCFFNPQYVLTLHNHFSMYNIINNCSKYIIEIDEAQLHHYRSHCSHLEGCEDKYKCRKVMDNSIWRYRDTLINKTKATLEELDLKY